MLFPEQMSVLWFKSSHSPTFPTNELIQRYTNLKGESKIEDSFPYTSKEQTSNFKDLSSYSEDVLLSTVLFNIRDIFGTLHKVRGIVDCELQVTFINEASGNGLGLKESVPLWLNIFVRTCQKFLSKLFRIL
ncbi:hypothetical protein HHI36_019798 [Cryptolaemus montrouzieri]|uniref:Uncharacterized protein n=1 Tax=Cryptolaemus montrouzieri TaxID=559131 RepID=A0ABD2N897_9CUCU